MSPTLIPRHNPPPYLLHLFAALTRHEQRVFPPHPYPPPLPPVAVPSPPLPLPAGTAGIHLRRSSRLSRGAAFATAVLHPPPSTASPSYLAPTPLVRGGYVRGQCNVPLQIPPTNLPTGRETVESLSPRPHLHSLSPMGGEGFRIPHPTSPLFLFLLFNLLPFSPALSSLTFLPP